MEFLRRFRLFCACKILELPLRTLYAVDSKKTGAFVLSTPLKLPVNPSLHILHLNYQILHSNLGMNTAKHIDWHPQTLTIDNIYK